MRCTEMNRCMEGVAPICVVVEGGEGIRLAIKGNHPMMRGVWWCVCTYASKETWTFKSAVPVCDNLSLVLSLMLLPSYW